MIGNVFLKIYGEGKIPFVKLTPKIYNSEIKSIAVGDRC